jgi:hypothetical protein
MTGRRRPQQISRRALQKQIERFVGLLLVLADDTRRPGRSTQPIVLTPGRVRLEVDDAPGNTPMERLVAACIAAVTAPSSQ